MKERKKGLEEELFHDGDDFFTFLILSILPMK